MGCGAGGPALGFAEGSPVQWRRQFTKFCVVQSLGRRHEFVCSSKSSGEIKKQMLAGLGSNSVCGSGPPFLVQGNEKAPHCLERPQRLIRSTIVGFRMAQLHVRKKPRRVKFE